MATHLCSAGVGESNDNEESRKIGSLDELFNELTRILHKQDDPEKLIKAQQCMESYNGTDWILHTQTPEAHGFKIYGYSRAQVRTQPDLFNMLVLTWSPRSKSAVHSHPCERCFLMPLQGDLAELRYQVTEDPINKDAPPKTKLMSEDPMANGKAYWIDDSVGWHSVQNRSAGLSVSLHVYIPSFERCKIVDSTTGTIRTVNCYPQNTERMRPLHDKLMETTREYMRSLEKPSERPVINLRSSDDLEAIFSEKCALAFDKPFKVKANVPCDDDSLLAAVKHTLDFSTVSGHLYFFNQLFARAEPLAVAADGLASAINANMYAYENAPVFMLMERRLLEHLAACVGWDKPIDLMRRDTIGDAVSNVIVAADRVEEEGGGVSPSVNINNSSNGMLFPSELCSSLWQKGAASAPVPRSRSSVQMSDWEHFDAILNPSGALSNIMSMHVARFWKLSGEGQISSKFRGNGGVKLAAFMSSQGHESFEKAANLIGIGSQSLVRVPVDPKTNQMSIPLLRKAVALCVSHGFVPFFVAGHAGTTVVGAFDDFVGLREVCDEYGMWLHIDGALGASYLLCKTEEPYKSMCRGFELADSCTWNLHKLLGVPLQCSAFLTRHAHILSRAHAVNNKRRSRLDGYSIASTVDCTFMASRRADAFKAWLLWKKVGDVGMANRIRLTHFLARELAEMVTTFPRKWAKPKPCAKVPPKVLVTANNSCNDAVNALGNMIKPSSNNNPASAQTTASLGANPSANLGANPSANLGANPSANLMLSSSSSVVSTEDVSSPEMVNNHNAAGATTVTTVDPLKNLMRTETAETAATNGSRGVNKRLVPPVGSTELEYEEVVPAGMPVNVHESAFWMVWEEPISVNVCFWWIPYELRPLATEIAADRSLAQVFIENAQSDTPISASCRKLADALENVAPAIKTRLHSEGSLMVDFQQVNNLPPFWRVPILNPDLSRADLFAVLRILNNTALACFPPQQH